MAKGSYVFKDGKFVPKAETKLNKKVYISMDEIPPTEHPADGKTYTSRKKYNATTRAFGLEEAYGEDDKYWEREKNPNDNMREDILKSIAQLNYGEGITDEERDICKLRDQKEEWEMD